MHPSLHKLAGVTVFGLAAAASVACASQQTTGATWVAIIALIVAVPVATSLGTIPPAPKAKQEEPRK